MTIQLIRKLIIASSVISVLHGCIYENPQPCEEVSNMRFFYLMNPENKNLLEESVKQLDVYIFNEDGIYIGKKTHNGSHIPNDYFMPMNELPDGVYTFVVVGYKNPFFNIGVFDPLKPDTQFNNGLTIGESNLNDFRLKTTYKDHSFFPLKMESLLRGNLVLRTITKKEQSVLDVFMIQYTNKIQITLTGLETKGYAPIIYANNGRYDYQNKIPEDAQTKTYLPTNINGNTFQFDVLRLIDHGKMMLQFVDSKGIAMPGVQPLNIIKLIQQSPSYQTQSDLDRENIFNLDISYQKLSMVEIDINGWSTIIVNPEL